MGRHGSYAAAAAVAAAADATVKTVHPWRRDLQKKKDATLLVTGRKEAQAAAAEEVDDSFSDCETATGPSFSTPGSLQSSPEVPAREPGQCFDTAPEDSPATTAGTCIVELALATQAQSPAPEPAAAPALAPFGCVFAHQQEATPPKTCSQQPSGGSAGGAIALKKKLTTESLPFVPIAARIRMAAVAVQAAANLPPPPPGLRKPLRTEASAFVPRLG